jgi:thiamine transport system ATP-binding protein
VLAVEGVTVRFGETPALTEVDLVVAEGEVVCVLGPSGSGKSTLLQVITGLLVPDAGRVTWDGEDLAGVPTHKRGFGLMFQDHALFPHRSVAANIGFGLRMQHRPAAEVERRVAQLLGTVGLAGYGRRAITELSGGEQQRVALARALAPEPRVLLLDEPLGALDRALREDLVEELGEIFDRLGTTVLYVTHDQDEALSLADRLVVMRGGQVVQEGDPTAVWRKPADDFVAGFLAATSIVQADELGLEGEGLVSYRRLRRRADPRCSAPDPASDGSAPS